MGRMRGGGVLMLVLGLVVLVSGSGPPPPPPGNGFTKSAKSRHWVGFSLKIKKIASALGHVLSSSYFFHGNKIKHMFSEGSLQSFIPERVTINIRGGGGS